jgi:hypothetical protein
VTLIQGALNRVFIDVNLIIPAMQNTSQIDQHSRIIVNDNGFYGLHSYLFPSRCNPAIPSVEADFRVNSANAYSENPELRIRFSLIAANWLDVYTMFL